MMLLGLIIVFLSFCFLGVANLREAGQNAFHRSKLFWFIDSSSLLSQGLVIPLIQSFLLSELWKLLFPGFAGGITVPVWAAFALSFVFVDYLYYWNHRLLHSRALWPWHRIHHSAEKMDILVTSRNSLLTPGLIIYVWVNSVLIYLLAEPGPFVLATSVGAALDLWRHSGRRMRASGLLHSFISPWLILPQNHAWHHSATRHGCNFGANLNVWDKLHGTFYAADSMPEKLGLSADDLVKFQDFLWPLQEKPSVLFSDAEELAQ